MAFYSQFYRCYSPIAFPQKTDKEGAFVRHYVPELAAFDKKYIYEPWKAPIADQKKWGCLIKGDGGASEGVSGLEMKLEHGGQAVYPKPMFDFGTRREICIQGLKKAYDVGLRGNDKQVLDGSWRQLFADDAEGPTEGKKGSIGAMLAGGPDVDDEEGGADEEVKSPKSGSKHRRADSRGDAQPTMHAHFKKVKK